MTVKEKLIELIESLSYDVSQQGSVSQEYPDHFFTFWNNSADDYHPYDDSPMGWVWSFDLMFYSIDPALVNSMLEEARTLLKANGWIVFGKGYDVASDYPTHTGRGINVLYIEHNEE